MAVIDQEYFYAVQKACTRIRLLAQSSEDLAYHHANCDVAKLDAGDVVGALEVMSDDVPMLLKYTNELREALEELKVYSLKLGNGGGK